MAHNLHVQLEKYMDYEHRMNFFHIVKFPPSKQPQPVLDVAMIFTGPEKVARAEHSGVAGGQSPPEEHQECDQDTVNGRRRQEDGRVIFIIGIVVVEADHAELPISVLIA